MELSQILTLQQSHLQVVDSDGFLNARLDLAPQKRAAFLDHGRAHGTGRQHGSPFKGWVPSKFSVKTAPSCSTR